MVMLDDRLLDDEYEGLPLSNTTIITLDALHSLLRQFVHVKALDVSYTDSLVSLENGAATSIVYTVLAIRMTFKRVDINSLKVLAIFTYSELWL